MRTLFLALATSATIFATGVTPVQPANRVTPVVASEYRYCLQGDDYAGAGDREFASYVQCEAAASGRTASCAANPNLAAANPYLANAVSGDLLEGRIVADAECVTSKIRWLGPLCICRKAKNRSGDRSG